MTQKVRCQEVRGRTESWHPGLPGTKFHPNWPQPVKLTTNSGRMRHHRRANHSISHHGTPNKSPVIIPDPHQPSTPYHTHPSRNHHHFHIFSDQENIDILQQAPPLDKDFKHSYAVLVIYQIYIQYQQTISTNNKDTPKTKKKQMIRRNFCQRYYIWVKIGKHSRV